MYALFCIIHLVTKNENKTEATNMNAETAKSILNNREAGYRGESYLWKIRDLRNAGLDFQTARAIVELPELIDFLLPSR